MVIVNIKRKDIHVLTFKKIEDFLNNQESYVFKSDIVRQLKVDYNSLNVALGMLKIRTNKEGKIKIRC